MSLLRIAKRLKLVVNPAAIEADIWGGSFRTPAPTSQPKYIPPTTDNSRISNNYYFQRDSRRDFPQTTFYTNPTVPAIEGATVAALPSGPGMNVVATTAEQVVQAAADLPLPPAISKKKLEPSPDSSLPTDSPTTYFHVAGYQ